MDFHGTTLIFRYLQVLAYEFQMLSWEQMLNDAGIPMIVSKVTLKIEMKNYRWKRLFVYNDFKVHWKG